jgi:hypothetical protein
VHCNLAINPMSIERRKSGWRADGLIDVPASGVITLKDGVVNKALATLLLPRILHFMPL